MAKLRGKVVKQSDWSDNMLNRRLMLVAMLAILIAPTVQAQPTFKLSVKPD